MQSYTTSVIYFRYHLKFKIIFNIFTYLHSDRTSERGYDILLQQYIVTWEEANKNRMFLPSRGTSGNGEYGVCEDKNEVIISSNILMNLNTMFSRSFCSHVMFSCGKWEQNNLRHTWIVSTEFDIDILTMCLSYFSVHFFITSI